MIFPCGLPDRGKKKTKKNLQLRKLSLSLHCCLILGQFCIALAALFKTKNRMFECSLSRSTIQTQGNINTFVYIPRMMYRARENIIRGLFFLLSNYNLIYGNNW